MIERSRETPTEHRSGEAEYGEQEESDHRRLTFWGSLIIAAGRKTGSDSE